MIRTENSRFPYYKIRFYLTKNVSPSHARMKYKNSTQIKKLKIDSLLDTFTDLSKAKT